VAREEQPVSEELRPLEFQAQQVSVAQQLQERQVQQVLRAWSRRQEASLRSAL
jgi:hypothetical protein